MTQTTKTSNQIRNDLIEEIVNILVDIAPPQGQCILFQKRQELREQLCKEECDYYDV